MRFHQLAVSTIALLAIGAKNYGYCNAQEITEAPEVEVPQYEYPEGSDEFTFEADVNKMLDIVVHSLYQNKDIFLRELISNASDALDKIRFLAIEDPDILDGEEKMEVKIEYDEDEKTISIIDTGIGMTKEDLSTYLGTVARSGTTKFIEAMKEGAVEMDQIGQFGVGFYSTFLVSDRVRVSSRHPSNDEQWVWETQSEEGSYHIYKDPRGNTLGRGTEITLFLKDEAMEYCDGDRLIELAGHFSEFVVHPISVRTVEEVEIEDEEDEDEDDVTDIDEEDGEDDALDVSDDAEKEEGGVNLKLNIKRETVKKYDWELVNTQQAIWSRDKDEITDDEYQDFWKVISKSANNATAWNHFKAEGNINFQSILYLPEDVPPEFVQGRYAEKIKGGLKLYVKKVLISDEFELLPNYLSWMKGVVDSDDLPLNVGRDTLQESKNVAIIKKKLTRKAIEMITKMAKASEKEKFESEGNQDPTEAEIDADGNIIETPKEESPEGEDEEEKEDEYMNWYKNFGPALKFGVMDDYGNRSKLLKLLRYKSLFHNAEDDVISLNDYMGNMKIWQDDIFYIAGSTVEELEDSVFLKKFKAKGIDVLFFTEPVDEYMISSTPDFEGKKFKSITKENIEFGDEDEDMIKRREKVYNEQYKPLTKFMKKLFGKKVFKVTVAKGLEDDPAVVTTPEHQHSANMERILRAQAYYTEESDHRIVTKRILEINPRHPIVSSLLEMVTPPEGDEDTFEAPEEAGDVAWMLHDMALLNSGFPIVDKDYAVRTTRVLQAKLSLDSLELADEIEPPPEPEDYEEEEEESIVPDDFDLDNDFDTEDLGDFVME